MNNKKTPSKTEVTDNLTSEENITLRQKSTGHWPFERSGFMPFNSLRKEVDDIFNQFTDRFGMFNRQTSEGFQIPALDVDETETALEITAEMPGVYEADIDVSVTDSVLTIHGEKQSTKQSKDSARRISERSFGVFERTIALPFKCEVDSIDAQYDNGVLQISIPKPENLESKPQKVAIKSAA